MHNHPGLFIVIEGSDGSGKSTQLRLIVERLKAVGHDVEVIKFPQYDSTSSVFVKAYLNGDYGPAEQVSPYTASLFYALDRYHASFRLKSALKKGKIVVADRYVGSNMAHQGSKFTNLAEQRGFFVWEESLEFELLAIPRPDLNIYLRVPVDVSIKLMEKRTKRKYTNKKRDEHEKDEVHLRKTAVTYDLLCKLFPKDFKEIQCTKNGQLLGIIEVNELIWQQIKPLLPAPKRKGQAAVVSLGEPSTAAKSSQMTELSQIKAQMLKKLDSLKKANQKKPLRLAINLITPLLEHKKELTDIVMPRAPTKLTKNDGPEPINSLISQVSREIVAIPADEEVKLLRFKPKNEFQLLDNSKSASLDYHQKKLRLERTLLENAFKFQYTLEATLDFRTALAIKKQLEVKEIKLLGASPRLGYSIPKIVESTYLESLYAKAFDVSNQLYRQSVAKNKEAAIYKLLLGHKARWQLDIDASAMRAGLKSVKDHDVMYFLKNAAEKISEVHPHVAKSILSTS